MMRDIGDHQRIAQIGLVGAIFQHRVVPRNARELARWGHLADLPVLGGKLFKDPADHRLHRFPDLLLRDEAHLQIELVELAGQTVGAGVLVAETRGDLKVTVKARHHQQLLILLRRLRQSIKFSGMDTAGHQKIARTLGAAGGEDRGGIFGETNILHRVPHGADDLGASDDIGVQRLAPQVEEAVLQADVLRIFLLARHRHRQFRCRRQNSGAPRKDLDRAGRQIGVHRASRTRLDQTVDGDDAFYPRALQHRQGRRIAVRDYLGDAVMVAQIDEQHAAMIALAVHPARQADRRALISGAEGCASV